jgi:hypothetical protein
MAAKKESAKKTPTKSAAKGPKVRFIRHARKPGWGIGRVLSEDEANILVYFEAVGPKRLRKAMAQLESVPDEDVPPNDLLRHLKPDAEGTYAVPPLTFEQMVQNFLRIEGGGFDHPHYIAEERVYKEEAVALAAKLLAPASLKAALKDGHFSLVFDAYKKVVQATNILSPWEKAKLSSLSPERHRAFAEPFVACLLGDGAFPRRFDDMAEAFLDLGIASWPTCTYGLFMTKPTEHLVVKPLFVQRAAAALGYEISYESTPSAATYDRILKFASYISEKLRTREMIPRDMIDVQGFLWLGTGGGDGV